MARRLVAALVWHRWWFALHPRLHLKVATPTTACPMCRVVWWWLAPELPEMTEITDG